MPKGTVSAYRWPCSVPGCRCTVPNAAPYSYGCWALCRKHWPLVPIEYRKALRRADRRLDALYARKMTGDNDFALAMAYGRAHRALGRLVDRVLRYAIERALGLA